MQKVTVVEDLVIKFLLLFPHIMKTSEEEEALHIAEAEAAVGAQSDALWLQGPFVLKVLPVIILHLFRVHAALLWCKSYSHVLAGNCAQGNAA
jgi:hypothetical protein